MKRQKLIDELREVFQNQMDDLEEASARGLDRLAERGVHELEELRDQVASKTSGSSSARSAERASRAAKASARAEQRAAKAAKREDRAAKNARRASRSAERARRRAEGFRGRRRSQYRAKRAAEDGRSPAEIEHAQLVAHARRRANQRVAFLTHFGSYLATLAILLVTTRSIRVLLIVGLSWGLGVFCHYLWGLTAPALRDRWVEQEVGERSARDVQSERRHVETRSRRSLEELSASIAHEIRNPITAAKSLVQQMGEDPGSAENLEYAEVALSELDRVERSISHLLRYARDEEPRFEWLELRGVAEAAVEGLQDRARSANVDLIIEFDRAGKMRGDREKLRRVVENLISNAIEAMSAEETLSPTINVLGGENLAGNEIWLRVIDNGPGISASDRDRVWSPFFTTRHEGTGLGLALSRKTIEAHGGSIDLLADSRKRTEFVLSFPKEPSAENDEWESEVL